MEVVREIWVARAKGDEGEVELTIMLYHYYIVFTSQSQSEAICLQDGCGMFVGVS